MNVPAHRADSPMLVDEITPICPISRKMLLGEVMRILFSVGELEAELNANTKIIFLLRDALSRLGHEVKVVGLCAVSPPVKSASIERFCLDYSAKASQSFLEVTLERYRTNRFLLPPKVRFGLRHPFRTMALFFNRLFPKKSETYATKLQSIVNHFHPDVLICVTLPFRETKAVFDCISSVPLYVYQMDPWGLHEILRTVSPENLSTRIQDEKTVFSKATHIFTTPLLFSAYQENPDYMGLTDKMSPLEFPNILAPKNNTAISIFHYESEYYNILYAGVIADTYRNPRHFLEMITQLIGMGNKIRVFFVGISQSDVLSEYVERYPGHIFYHPHIAYDQMISTIQQADFLLNIGNTLTLQAPSKVLEYISFGKPVINIQKVYHCTSLRYFSNYPLVFQIEEYLGKDNIDTLFRWMQVTKGQAIPFADVQKMYGEFTPEVVASQIEQAIYKLSLP